MQLTTTIKRRIAIAVALVALTAAAFVGANGAWHTPGHHSANGGSWRTPVQPSNGSSWRNPVQPSNGHNWS
jgi:hypothetical protein